MCQATLKRLSNRFESCQAQKVASLLTEALRPQTLPRQKRERPPDRILSAAYTSGRSLCAYATRPSHPPFLFARRGRRELPRCHLGYAYRPAALDGGCLRPSPHSHGVRHAHHRRENGSSKEFCGTFLRTDLLSGCLLPTQRVRRVGPGSLLRAGSAGRAGPAPRLAARRLPGLQARWMR